MANKDQSEKNKKYYFTGIGLIFGTAIGYTLSMITTGKVVWAGIGTAVGLIIGAIIDGYKYKNNSE